MSVGIKCIVFKLYPTAFLKIVEACVLRLLVVANGSDEINISSVIQFRNAVRVGPQESEAESSQTRYHVDEAATVFLDDLSLTGYDPDRSNDEDRFVTFGISNSGRLLTVAHTDSKESIRIISARPATRAERNLYEEG